MTFDEVLAQVIQQLQREGRVSYRALKRRLGLDDNDLEDLKAELIDAKGLATDEMGRVLVWKDAAERSAPAAARVAEPPPKGYDTPRHLAQRILSDRRALEDERKQLTVLFADVTDSSGLAQRLDAEALHTLMDGVLRLVADIVYRYDGTVNQFLGDGLMALFGAPVALEDHAVRAVHAALAIHEAIAARNPEFTRDYAAEIRLRIGINTGLVVVGRIGDDLHMDYTAIGNTTHLAARLQAMAEPGAILIGEATYRLVEAYVVSEPLGLVDVRGQREPVAVYRVTGRLLLRSRMEVAAARGLTPIVGRQREVALLADRLALVHAGRGQLVGIVGEPGVGKSRLLHEFYRSLTPGSVTWLAGHCLGYSQSTPYQPLLEVIRACLQIDEADPAPRIDEKLRLAPAQTDPELAPMLPVLRELLTASVSDDEQLRHLDPKERRQRAFAAIRALIVAECRRCPVAIVLEDLHWIDQSSEDCLVFLVESLARLPVLLITTHRPGYTLPWVDKSYYTQIAIDVFTRPEAEALAATLLGSDTLPPDLLRVIHDKAGGNPLFIEEVTRSLLERGSLVRGDGGVSWTGESIVAMPETVLDIMRARIDRLDDSVKRTVQTAAVIGREFGLPLLARLAAGPGEAEHSLDALKRLELIYETRFFPDLEYIFKHAVVQDVAYQTLLAQRRQALHGAIGRAMEELYADRLDPHAALLAFHFARSADRDKALAYALRAGDHSARLYARAEATAHYDQALAIARALLPAADAQRALIDGMLKLAAVAQSARDVERDQRHLEEAQALAETLGDARRLAQVLYWRGRVHYVTGAFQAALEGARRSLAIADELKDETLAAPAVNLVGRVHWLQGDFAEAGRLLARSAEQMREIGNASEEATAVGFAGWALGFLGELPQALAYAERALRLARELQNPFAEAAAYMYRGAIHDQRGVWSEALADYGEARRLATEAGDLFRVYLVKCLEGRACAMAGEPPRGRIVLEEALALATQLRTTFVLAWPKAYLADCLRELGEHDRAHLLALEALQLATTAGDKYGQVMTHRALAQILAQRDPPDHEGAERAVREAIRLQHALGTRPELARSYLAWAALRRGQGDIAQARAYLNVALEMFRELDMRWDFGRAEQALAALA